MNTSFYTDVLTYDKQLTMHEIDTNIILSTGLNKKSAKKLAKKIISGLIEKIKCASPEEEEMFAQDNQEDILCLMGIFSFYCTVTGIHTDGKGGLTDLRRELGGMIRDSGIERSKRHILNDFLSDHTRIVMSEEFIVRYRALFLKRSPESPENGKMTNGFSKELSDIPALMGSQVLVYLRANLIASYLEGMKTDKVDNTRDGISKKVLEITN